MKNTFYKYSKYFAILLMVPVTFASCKKYLDVAPQAAITDEEVFGTFARYQGYVEDMYQAIPAMERSKYNVMNWNYSNDVYSVLAQTMSYFFERGDYWKWTNNTYSFFNGVTTSNINTVGEEAGNTNHRPGFWINGWRAIRTANIAIRNIDMLQGTQEERNLILGQAYFFRAFFHFNILKCWGGVPYVDKAFSGKDKLDWPRLSYLETAKRIAEDLEKAIQLLPKSWDETGPGQKLGNNAGRVTRGAAYGYLGKNWLYAASPLMNGMETGDYSRYNTELAKKAADAFNELLKLAEEGYYGLQTWEDYHKNFWTMAANENLLGKEWVWGHPYYKKSGAASRGEHTLTALGGTNTGYAPPTLELVNKFGMANGLPINAAGSGYDPNHPWDNRDPRFYYSLVLDGEKILHYTTNFPADTYAQFYLGGKHRINAKTGFGQKKFLAPGANSRDNKRGNYAFIVPYLRLAHAYLMYAEAANEGYGGPDGKSPGGVMSAKEAVNFVRTRAEVPTLDARYLTSKEVFRDAVRNEIGVETCLEGQQWFDYRRWYIAHLPENRIKTGLEYNKNHTYFKPVQMTEILFDPAKHYWLPFTRDEAALYPEFYQNPGW